MSNSIPPKPPRPLDYATPVRRGPAGGVPYLAQMALGAGALVLTIVLVVCLFQFVPSESMSDNTNYLVVLTGTCLSIAGFVVVTVLAIVRWRWPGFSIGVVTAIGLILLLGCGLCFGAFRGGI